MTLVSSIDIDDDRGQRFGSCSISNWACVKTAHTCSLYQFDHIGAGFLVITRYQYVALQSMQASLLSGDSGMSST